MDRRQKKTRNALFSAFRSLLEETSYSAITVQDIIDRADVGRSTFYAHFETKDDLLREMCEEIFSHVFIDPHGEETSHHFSEEDSDISHQITHLLYHMKENQDLMRGMISGDDGGLFMCYFKQYLNDVFHDYAYSQSEEVPHSYVLNHIVCDFSETVRWWLSSHPAYSPEEIASFYFTMNPID